MMPAGRVRVANRVKVSAVRCHNREQARAITYDMFDLVCNVKTEAKEWFSWVDGTGG